MSTIIEKLKKIFFTKEEGMQSTMEATIYFVTTICHAVYMCISFHHPTTLCYRYYNPQFTSIDTESQIK